MTSKPVEASRRQVALFLGLFSLSVVTDFRSWSALGADAEGIATWLGVLGFAVALVSGGSRVGLLAAGLGGLVMLGVRTHYSNHQMLYLNLCVSIVAVYLVRALLERRLRVGLSALHRDLAAVARLGFVAFYFWVAFHKLNPQFLDPAWSCAVHLLAVSARMAPLLEPLSAFEALAGPATLLAEWSVLVALLMPRLRVAGVVFAMAFHTTLSFAVPTFQYLVFGYALLFVPERVLADAGARLARLPGRGPAGWLPASPWGRAAVGVVAVVALDGFARWAVLPENIRSFGHVTYRVASFLALTGMTLAGVALLLPRFGALPEPDDRLLQRLPLPLWMLPLAMFLQGAQPHLGFKSIHSFAMFSNLDTDSGQTNHYVVPAWLQLSRNLDDPVVVHPGSDPRLALYTRNERLDGTVLRAGRAPTMARPFLSLQRYVTQLARAGQTGIRVDYTRAGVRRVVETAERDPELAGASFFVRRYLHTRPLALDHHGACRW